MRVHMVNARGPDEATSYHLLKAIEGDAGLSQRDLANRLGISLGKVNFCLKALIGKGCLKVRRFRNSKNKNAYLYLLTPQGIEEKCRLAARFLQIKMDEYEALKKELDELTREVSANHDEAGGRAFSRDRERGEGMIEDGYI